MTIITSPLESLSVSQQVDVYRDIVVIPTLGVEAPFYDADAIAMDMLTINAKYAVAVVPGRDLWEVAEKYRR